jgi:hypothetical protein
VLSREVGFTAREKLKNAEIKEQKVCLDFKVTLSCKAERK